MKPRYTTLLALITSAALISSCLTDANEDDTPSQYAIDFQLEDVNDVQIVDEDTLRITGVSFLQGEISLEDAGGDSTVLFDGPGVYTYQFPQGEYQRLLTGELSGGTYNNMTYNIVKAEADDENIPGNFIDGEDEDQRYSMIIVGVLNNSDFEYKSTQPYNLEFNLGSPVEVPSNNTSLVLAVNFDIFEAFLEADSSGFLDPAIPENAEQIDENIEGSIELLPFEE